MLGVGTERRSQPMTHILWIMCIGVCSDLLFSGFKDTVDCCVSVRINKLLALLDARAKQEEPPTDDDSNRVQFTSDLIKCKSILMYSLNACKSVTDLLICSVCTHCGYLEYAET